MPRVSTELSYFRRAQGHFTTTDNLDVAPSDFNSYCVTAPTDSRLPNGGGYQICGLLRHRADEVRPGEQQPGHVCRQLRGKQTEVFNGVDFAMNARLRSDLFVTGGFATGNTHFNVCDAFVDNPNTGFGLSAAAAGAGIAPVPGTGSVFSYCDFDTSWLTQLEGHRLLHAAVAADPDRRRAAEPARPADHRAVEHHAGRPDRPRPRAVGRRQHVARGAAHQAGDDVHAAPDAGGPAGLEELQAVVGRRRGCR